jgi:hypothetical protein
MAPKKRASESEGARKFSCSPGRTSWRLSKKGDRKERVGRVLQIRRERLTRRSLVGHATHVGNEVIPAPGSRARYFVKGEFARSPNGIELLGGATELDLPMRSSWSALEWPLVCAPASLIAVLALVGGRRTGRGDRHGIVRRPARESLGLHVQHRPAPPPTAAEPSVLPLVAVIAKAADGLRLRAKMERIGRC